MAKTPEKIVKDKVVEILKSEGAYYFYPVASGYGTSGIPDIVACISGAFIGIECKAAGNKPTALQARSLERIRMAGGVAVVVDDTNLDMLRPLLRKLKQRSIAA